MGDQVDPELVLAELEQRAEWARAHGHVYELAVWQLLLGRAEEGLETLRRAAGEQIDPRVAVVAGEWERAADAAARALDESPSYVAGYREYIRALYALVTGDAAAAKEQLAGLRAHVASRAPRAGGAPPGAVELLEGLLDEAAGSVETGVDALLSWHMRRARARSDIFNSGRAVVALDAVVGLLLAHRRGLTVDVAAKYRAASVPLLVVHLAEWRGEPLQRALPVSVDVDLVAGPWLSLHGLELAAPPTGRPHARRTETRPRRRAAELDEDAVRAELAGRLQGRLGSPWQLSSWAAMLGDWDGARSLLAEAAAAARRQWEESAPRTRPFGRLLGRDSTLPNNNYVREHFGLALAVGDEDALRVTSEILQGWDERLALEAPYAHAHGYLDLVRHLLAGAEVSRAEAGTVLGPLRDGRVACVGLAERSPELVERGLRGMLGEHAGTLERQSSPPPPICAPAVHLAAAAQRLGVSVELDEDARVYDVPIAVAADGRKVGRLRADLLGTELWRRR
jgi:hypothetical protein